VETVRSRKALRAQSARRARPKKRRNGHIRHSERNEREERDAHSTKERANLPTDLETLVGPAGHTDGHTTTSCFGHGASEALDVAILGPGKPLRLTQHGVKDWSHPSVLYHRSSSIRRK
jgi:hypothetical protein